MPAGPRRSTLVPVALIALLVALAACGGGGPTEESDSTAAATASAVADLEGLYFDVRRDPG